MIAYIDESGDEGTIGKGSRWLIFGCAMVADANLDVVRNTVQLACKISGGRRNAKTLHFKDIPHDDKRGIISIVRDSPWLGSVIASDTTEAYSSSMLSKPKFQYNYSARYVVERISAMADALQEPATIVFEDRRNFDLGAFRAYMDKLMLQADPRIDPNRISTDRIYVMQKGVDECLCIADGLANAAYKALEPHRTWGTCETAYLEGFKPSLWKGPQGRQDLYEWGFVLMPTPISGRFTNEYPWIADLAK